jgi:hypothetical protein
MADEIGAPYLHMALAIQNFLKDKEMGLMDIWHEMDRECKKKKLKGPTPQSLYMAAYGTRPIPLEVLVFMQGRYGFSLRFDQCFGAKNRQEVITKTNNIRLPRMRELF